MGVPPGIRGTGAPLRFLIDECLHASLTRTANEAGFEAYHVVHRGWAGVPDHRLLEHALRQELTFVTNNGKDFKKLMSKVGVHPGLVIIRQCVEPVLQQELFRVALKQLAKLPDLKITRWKSTQTEPSTFTSFPDPRPGRFILE